MKMTTQTRTNIREKLAEFAANTTYQLWYLKKSTSSTTPPTKASPQFIRFCKQLISVTRLSETAVILALKYVQKLIVGEGHISTENGWEYRLFTVSLILANKTLDDHSYTNKTWSQVTTIPLLELNQVEREFLKNCGYELYVSHTEYLDWLRSLQAFNLLNQEQQQQQQQQRQQQQPSIQQSQKIRVPPGMDLPGISHLFERSRSQGCNYDLFGNGDKARVQRNHYQPGPGVIQRPVKTINQNRLIRNNDGISVQHFPGLVYQDKPDDCYDSYGFVHSLTSTDFLFNHQNSRLVLIYSI